MAEFIDPVFANTGSVNSGTGFNPGILRRSESLRAADEAALNKILIKKSDSYH